MELHLLAKVEEEIDLLNLLFPCHHRPARKQKKNIITLRTKIHWILLLFLEKVFFSLTGVWNIWRTLTIR